KKNAEGEPRGEAERKYRRLKGNLVEIELAPSARLPFLGRIPGGHIRGRRLLPGGGIQTSQMAGRVGEEWYLRGVGRGEGEAPAEPGESHPASVSPSSPSIPFAPPGGVGFGLSRPTAPRCSALDDADRAHAGDLLAEAGAVHHIDHLIDVLVRLGLLLRQPLAALSAGDDPARLQLLVDPPARRILDRGGAAHGPARAVAGGAEGLLHAPPLADQHPPRPPH